jgi:ABC-type nitrate/sulfonate/bicarbonate transport system substrate-binding protein
MKRMRLALAGLALAGLAGLSPGGSAPAQSKVSVGLTRSATDVGLWVAQKKGFFRDENIDVDLIPRPGRPSTRRSWTGPGRTSDPM